MQSKKVSEAKMEEEKRYTGKYHCEGCGDKCPIKIITRYHLGKPAGTYAMINMFIMSDDIYIDPNDEFYHREFIPQLIERVRDNAKKECGKYNKQK